MPKMMTEDNFKKALNKAFTILSHASKTENEMKKKLAEKEFEKDVIEEVVLYLKEQKMLDDQYYADRWINNNSTISKKIIFQKLLVKGISKETICQAIENAEIDEYNIALNMAEKKIKNIKGNDSREKKNKLFTYMYSKGFDSETCNRVINHKNIVHSLENDD